MWEWYLWYSKYNLHLFLSGCFSVRLSVCAWAPPFGPYSLHTQWCSRCPGWRCTEQFWNDGPGWETQHMFWQGLHFLLGAAVHVQRLWLSAQRFSFFSVGQNRKWILNTCPYHTKTIWNWYYSGFGQRRAVEPLLFVLSRVVNVCCSLWVQNSNTVILFKTIFL